MNKKLYKVVLSVAALLLLLISAGKAESHSLAPSIIQQPSNLEVDYGANAMFKVVVKGGASYQWRKDGVDLADYGNVAGAQSSILKLVGVAQEDAGDYSVVVSNSAGAVISSTASLAISSEVIFSDDFESGMDKWGALGNGRGLGISKARTVSSKGNQSAMVSSSGDKIYRNLGVEVIGKMRATFWIYDDGNYKVRRFAELRGYTGKGHMTYVSPGGLKQVLAVGCYIDQSTLTNTGSLKSEVADPTKYQGRVVSGKSAGWFNLDAPNGPVRSVGWHKFEIVRDAKGTTVQFFVDGVLGRTVTEVEHVPVDCVTLGSIGKGAVVEQSFFDDVTIEAFPKKYNWKAKDSAGKGLFDWMQMRETGVDAVVTDIKEIKTVASANGASAVRVLGRWEVDGSGLAALDRRGTVEFSLAVPENDAYRIEIEGREKARKMPRIELPLIVWVDGEYLGRYNLSYGSETNGVVQCFTPFLNAGKHTVRISWDNVESYCSLYLQSVRIQSLSAPDINKNGLKDWVENRVLAQSGWDVAITNSRVSPVCIEGRGQYLSMMAVSAGNGGTTTDLPVMQGAGYRWYANVPLSPESATSLNVSYQNGVLTESTSIKWDVTDLLKATDTTIRKGDALLFSVVPDNAGEGVATIEISGVTNYQTAISHPVVHRFDEAGVFTVIGKAGQSSRSISVKVVDASFDGGPLAAWVGRRRYCGFTNLPPEAVVEHDPRISFVKIGKIEFQPTLQGVQYRLSVDAAEERHVVARLGANGPILGNLTINGFRLATPLDTYLRQVETFEDGSQAIDGGFVMSPVLPNVKVDVQVLVSGITFEDGTLSHQITTADFDNLGTSKLRFIRSAGVKTSVCHAAKAYQDGVLIGWPPVNFERANDETYK